MMINAGIAVFLFCLTFSSCYTRNYIVNSTDSDQCYSVSVRGENHRAIVTAEYCNGTGGMGSMGSTKISGVSLYQQWHAAMPSVNRSCPVGAHDVRVVIFSPNDDFIEQGASYAVYNCSVTRRYRTVWLSRENATRAAFLAYAACPNLVAMFYDGDGNPNLITTFDDPVLFSDIALLNWQYRVVAYWVACEVYNSPMLDAVTVAKPRRWSAGINDLLIGPSDAAAADAMCAALNGDYLAESFDRSIARFDRPFDEWGFGGFGTNKIG